MNLLRLIYHSVTLTVRQPIRLRKAKATSRERKWKSRRWRSGRRERASKGATDKFRIFRRAFAQNCFGSFDTLTTYLIGRVNDALVNIRGRARVSPPPRNLKLVAGCLQWCLSFSFTVALSSFSEVMLFFSQSEFTSRFVTYSSFWREKWLVQDWTWGEVFYATCKRWFYGENSIKKGSFVHEFDKLSINILI